MIKLIPTLNKINIKESWQDFIDNDGYWNIDLFKSIGLLDTLSDLVNLTHELKSSEVEDSSFQTSAELADFLRSAAKKIIDSANKIERMGNG